MHVGDRRQATILGAVAVGALGFLVMQLAPKGDASTPRAARAAATAPAASVPVREFGSVSRGSGSIGYSGGIEDLGAPFGATPTTSAPRAPSEPANSRTATSDAPPAPPVPSAVTPMAVDVAPLPRPAGAEVSSTRLAARTAPAAPTIKARLVATIGATKGGSPVALLTLDGADATLSTGDPLGERWLVSDIGERSIGLQSAIPGSVRRLRLTLGIETQL